MELQWVGWWEPMLVLMKVEMSVSMLVLMTELLKGEKMAVL